MNRRRPFSRFMILAACLMALLGAIRFLWRPPLLVDGWNANGGLDIVHQIVRDAGLTEVEPGTVTCIGIGPEKDSILEEFTGNLKLL